MSNHKNEIKKTEDEFNFLFLPKDVQGVILAFLNNEQLAKLRQLSKHFKSLAESMLPEPSRSRFAISGNLVPIDAEITKQMIITAADKLFNLGTQLFNNFKAASSKSKSLTVRGGFDQVIIEIKFPPGEVPKDQLSKPVNPEAVSFHVHRKKWQTISYNEAPLSSKQKLAAIIDQISNITSQKGWKSYKDTTKITIDGKEYNVPSPIANIYNIAQRSKDPEDKRLQEISTICQKLVTSEPKSAFFSKKKDDQKAKASDVAAGLKDIIEGKFKP